jgi:hypothetical protein
VSLKNQRFCPFGGFRDNQTKYVNMHYIEKNFNPFNQSADFLGKAISPKPYVASVQTNFFTTQSLLCGICVFHVSSLTLFSVSLTSGSHLSIFYPLADSSASAAFLSQLICSPHSSLVRTHWGGGAF